MFRSHFGSRTTRGEEAALVNSLTTTKNIALSTTREYKITLEANTADVRRGADHLSRDARGSASCAYTGKHSPREFVCYTLQPNCRLLRRGQRHTRSPTGTSPTRICRTFHGLSGRTAGATVIVRPASSCRSTSCLWTTTSDACTRVRSSGEPSSRF